MKSLHRLLLCIVYRLMLCYWFVRRPAGGGAYVAVWHGDRILLAKNSYKRQWTFPAGGRKAGERMVDCAARELLEEVGIPVKDDEIRFVKYFVSYDEFKTDRSAVFEVHLDVEPPITIDETEVIEASFAKFDDVYRQRENLVCIASQYVAWKHARRKVQSDGVLERGELVEV